MNLLLTRSIKQSNEIKSSIEDIGYKVVLEPLLTVEPLDNIDLIISNINFNDVELLIFTSINAINIFVSHCKERDIPIIVGSSKSALMAKDLGFKNIHCTYGDANSILKKIQKLNIKGKSIYFAGTDITLELSKELVSLGIKSEKIIIYKAHAKQNLSEQIINQIQNNKIDVITFFSKRTAEIFIKMINNILLEKQIDFSKITAIVLSKKIAMICKSLNWRNIKISSNITTESFLDLLKKHYDQERQN